MRVMEKLEKLIEKSLPEGYEFKLEYYRKWEDTGLQVIEFPGYYFAIWLKNPEWEPGPGHWRFADYKDGELIGTSYKEAKWWIENELPKQFEKDGN